MAKSLVNLKKCSSHGIALLQFSALCHVFRPYVPIRVKLKNRMHHYVGFNGQKSLVFGDGGRGGGGQISEKAPQNRCSIKDERNDCRDSVQK